jgi:hypothetical protein
LAALGDQLRADFRGLDNRAAIQALEACLPPDQVGLSFAGALLFRMELQVAARPFPQNHQ